MTEKDPAGARRDLFSASLKSIPTVKEWYRVRQYRKRSMKVEVSNGSSFLKRRVMAIRALALVGVIPMEDKSNGMKSRGKF